MSSSIIRRLNRAETSAPEPASTTGLLGDKLAPPDAAVPVLLRPRLFDVLSHSTEQRVTALGAPAGSGKTMPAGHLAPSPAGPAGRVALARPGRQRAPGVLVVRPGGSAPMPCGVRPARRPASSRPGRRRLPRTLHRRRRPAPRARRPHPGRRARAARRCAARRPGDAAPARPAVAAVDPVRSWTTCCAAGQAAGVRRPGRHRLRRPGLYRGGGQKAVHAAPHRPHRPADSDGAGTHRGMADRPAAGRSVGGMPSRPGSATSQTSPAAPGWSPTT